MPEASITPCQGDRQRTNSTTQRDSRRRKHGNHDSILQPTKNKINKKLRSGQRISAARQGGHRTRQQIGDLCTGPARRGNHHSRTRSIIINLLLSHTQGAFRVSVASIVGVCLVEAGLAGTHSQLGDRWPLTSPGWSWGTRPSRWPAAPSPLHSTTLERDQKSLWLMILCSHCVLALPVPEAPPTPHQSSATVVSSASPYSSSACATLGCVRHSTTGPFFRPNYLRLVPSCRFTQLYNRTSRDQHCRRNSLAMDVLLN